MTPGSLGRYEIRAELGRGSMGVVYRGHDPVIDRPVALKTVSVPEAVSPGEREQFLQRFFQEARAAGKLLHPNIVVTYDAATDEASGTPFIAMELIDGESLSGRLRRDQRMPWQQALSLVGSLARALDHAHKNGIVHRDIKPANVMLTRDGVPKLADFGIAKLPSAELTKTGMVLGTPYYMSPEQLSGEPLDGRSDIFSLGSLLYAIVTGQRPFEGNEIASIASQVLYKHPRPPSEILEELPKALDGVVARALMKSPAERYATGEALARDLEAIGEGREPEGAAAVFESTRASPPVGRQEPSVSAARDVAPPTVVTTRARARGGAPPSSGGALRPLAIVAALVVIAMVTGLVVFRAAISARLQLREATKAMEAGELEQSEATLETLVAEHPELDEATTILRRVSSDIVRPLLPFERMAVHDHRFGDCTGRLVFQDSGVEFASRSHQWTWRFDQIVTLDERGVGRLFLESRESDMMGLLDRKNYNFRVLEEPIESDTWKRYLRMYRLALETPGPGTGS